MGFKLQILGAPKSDAKYHGLKANDQEGYTVTVTPIEGRTVQYNNVKVFEWLYKGKEAVIDSPVHGAGIVKDLRTKNASVVVKKAKVIAELFEEIL